VHTPVSLILVKTSQVNKYNLINKINSSETKNWFFMKTSIRLLLTFIFVAGTWQVFSQILEMEKTYKLEQPITRGSLYEFSYDTVKKIYTLDYLSLYSPTKLNICHLHFDTNFTFLDRSDSICDFNSIPNLLHQLSYEGDVLKSEGLFVDFDHGSLVAGKKEVTRTYNWVKFDYSVTTKTLDKVKLRGDENENFDDLIYLYEDDVTSTAFILAGEKSKEDKLNHFKEFHFIQVTKNLTIGADELIKFDYPQNVVFRSTFLADDGSFDFSVFIFTPRGVGSKYSEPDPTCYTLIAIDKEGKIIDKIPFKVPSTQWDIENLLSPSKGEFYLYGPAGEGKKEYYNPELFLSKIKNLVVARFKDHKLNFISLTNIDEIKSKFKTNPNVKSGKPYRGGKYKYAVDKVFSNGSLFISGQNWDKGGGLGVLSAVQTGSSKIEYKDCFAFLLNSDGSFAGNYSLDVKWFMKDLMSTQSVFQGKSDNYGYWSVSSAGIADYIAVTFSFALPSTLMKINLKTGALESSLDLVNANLLRKKLVMDFNHPYIEIKKGTLVFLGYDRIMPDGYFTIWLGKIRLD